MGNKCMCLNLKNLNTSNKNNQTNNYFSKNGRVITKTHKISNDRFSKYQINNTRKNNESNKFKAETEIVTKSVNINKNTTKTISDDFSISKACSNENKVEAKSDKFSQSNSINTFASYVPNTKMQNLVSLKAKATISSYNTYSSLEQLNQQLIESVKTNKYEITLRLLTRGANPNYRNQEGSYCLHLAVLNNQMGQIELLCLHDADLTSLDRNGINPYELAKINNTTAIADRLLEIQFEFTDKISNFLFNKRPDHKSGQHFIVPNRIERFLFHREENPMIKIQQLPNHLFKDLTRDIYDELNLRQNEKMQKFIISKSLIFEQIPFPIIKSCFSQNRNQLRQNLALKFNKNEFNELLFDILKESKRRYNTQSNQI